MEFLGSSLEDKIIPIAILGLFVLGIVMSKKGGNSSGGSSKPSSGSAGE